MVEDAEKYKKYDQDQREKISKMNELESCYSKMVPSIKDAKLANKFKSSIKLLKLYRSDTAKSVSEDRDRPIRGTGPNIEEVD